MEEVVSFAHQLLGILAYLLLLSGVVLLHIRLRRASSLSLLLSVAAFAVWIFWGEGAVWRALPQGPDLGTDTSNASNLIYLGRWHSVPYFLETALLLWLAGSFFFSIRAVPQASRRAA